MQVLENGIQATEVIPGRSELIDEDQDYPVMIDAANTPESLSRLLDSVRETRPARVILVFGCEGERNKSLRPFMGEIAHYKVRTPLTSLRGYPFQTQLLPCFLAAVLCPQASCPSAAAVFARRPLPSLLLLQEWHAVQQSEQTRCRCHCRRTR